MVFQPSVARCCCHPDCVLLHHSHRLRPSLTSSLLRFHSQFGFHRLHSWSLHFCFLCDLIMPPLFSAFSFAAAAFASESFVSSASSAFFIHPCCGFQSHFASAPPLSLSLLLFQSHSASGRSLRLPYPCGSCHLLQHLYCISSVFLIKMSSMCFSVPFGDL